MIFMHHRGTEDTELTMGGFSGNEILPLSVPLHFLNVYSHREIQMKRDI